MHTYAFCIWSFTEGGGVSKIPAISLRSQWLGEKLRDARNESGYTLREAAQYLQTDHTTLGRFERGTHKMRRAYVKELIDFYSITDRRSRDVLIQLAEDAWRRDWWDGDTSDLETGFLDYTWLEARATRVCTFEPLLIHGLLQTREYAEAVMCHGLNRRIVDSEVRRMVELRVKRQKILTSNDPTQISAILEEPAIRRPVGGVATLKDQLQHLIEISKRPNADIRILPMSVEWDTGYRGAFACFEMPDPYPSVAYTEDLVGRTFYEVEDKVRRFNDAYSELKLLALKQKDSTQFIESVLKELK